MPRKRAIHIVNKEIAFSCRWWRFGLQVLARGGAQEAAAAAAENAAREAEARQSAASGPVQLDEMGRDLNVMARRDAEERAASRHARLNLALPFLVRQPACSQRTLGFGKDVLLELEPSCMHLTLHAVRKAARCRACQRWAISLPRCRTYLQHLCVC